MNSKLFNNKKKWGQNFLVDKNIPKKIISLARENFNTEKKLIDLQVLEIGAGKGALTKELVKNFNKVACVEVDTQLKEHLEQNFPSVNFIFKDALLLNEKDFKDKNGSIFIPDVLVANLPYNIAATLLLTLFENFPGITHALVMVQKEVAMRLVATSSKNNKKNFSKVSLKTAWYSSNAKIVAKIPRTAFAPIPNVDSVMLFLELNSDYKNKYNAKIKKEVFSLIDAAFLSRRKTIAKNLQSFGLTKEKIQSVGINPLSRGEELSLDGYLKLVSLKKNDNKKEKNEKIISYN